MTVITESAVLDALRTVQEPELGRDIVTLEMVKSIAIDDAHVAFTIGNDGVARGTEDLTDGVWIMELTADIGHEHPWRDMRRIVIRDGEFR